MNVPIFSAEHVEAFVLILLRVGAIISMIPVFSERSVPVRVKMSLAIIISFVIFPVVGERVPSLSQYHLLQMIFLMAGEVFIGITIGFVSKLVFAAIQLAGNIIGFQMGFAIVNVIDPMTSQQVSIIAELKYLIAMLLFLTIDGHHLFFAAIVRSYDLVAPLAFHFSGPLMQLILNVSREMFIIAVKIAAPIMAVMIFSNVALGIVARTVPQMNIFIVGFPLQISMGLIFLGLTAPVFIRTLHGMFGGLEGKITTVLRLL